ncbi:MAG: archaeal proteasome endopeptidase complex subunit beta [Candidatus Hydrothermarchaeota archaeon]
MICILLTILSYESYILATDGVLMGFVGDKPTLKGTTTVGVVCDDGVVLGTETRVSMGNLIVHKKFEKIFEIDTHIAATTSGVVSDAQGLMRYAQAEAKLYRMRTGRPMPVEATATLMANILHYYKIYPFMVQLVIGGYDERPRLFSLDAVGSVIEENVISTGSGSPIAYGIIEGEYKKRMNVKEGIDIVRSALMAAMGRDVFSGNEISICVINEKGISKL